MVHLTFSAATRLDLPVRMTSLDSVHHVSSPPLDSRRVQCFTIDAKIPSAGSVWTRSIYLMTKCERNAIRSRIPMKHE